MIEKLKKKIDKLGIAKVSADLGYRSGMSIYHWIKKGEIPKINIEKVKKYLKENK